MEGITRRQMLGGSMGLAAAAPFPEPPPSRRRLNVVFVGAHPDDVETAAGGTVARYGDLGHDVTILYLTRGYKDRPDLNLWAKVDVGHQARGFQAGCQYAEGFVAHSMNRDLDLGLSARSERR